MPSLEKFYIWPRNFWKFISPPSLILSNLWIDLWWFSFLIHELCTQLLYDLLKIEMNWMNTTLNCWNSLIWTKCYYCCWIWFVNTKNDSFSRSCHFFTKSVNLSVHFEIVCYKYVLWILCWFQKSVTSVNTLFISTQEQV